MINKINFAPSFASTRINFDKQDKDGLCHVVIPKYLDPVNDYFEVKSVQNKFSKPQELADEIELNQAAVYMDKDGFTIVGKDGGEGGADTFIGKILTKLFPDNAVFKDDIKPLEDKGEAIDLDFEI